MYNRLKPKKLFKNIDWNIVKIASRFTTWNIDIGNLKLTKLPLLPNHVGEDFSCHYNNLTSLEGAPNKVGGGFYCFNNNLTSLEGTPNYVGGGFYCYYNKLTSLDGAPNHVGRYFYCYNNQLSGSIPMIFPGKDLHKYINL